MRIPFIAGNWKMFKTVQEAVVFVKELRSAVKDVTDVEIVVAPPFTAVHAVAEAARNANIGVAAQDLYWEREGAFTGEVSPAMVKEAGAAFAIVGHSERRRLFGETDQTVNRRLVAALGASLTPIVCIGETLEEREAEQTLTVLDRQIKDGLDGLSAVRRVFAIDIPLLIPQFRIVVILSGIFAVQNFIPILLLTNGGPGTATLVPGLDMYQSAFQNDQYGYGMAIGTLLFVAMLIFTLIVMRALRPRTA